MGLITSDWYRHDKDNSTTHLTTNAPTAGRCNEPRRALLTRTTSQKPAGEWDLTIGRSRKPVLFKRMPEAFESSCFFRHYVRCLHVPYYCVRWCESKNDSTKTYGRHASSLEIVFDILAATNLKRYWNVQAYGYAYAYWRRLSVSVTNGSELSRTKYRND